MRFFFTSYPERTIIWLTISTRKWLTIAKTENYVVVIREKDNRGIHSKDHNWVDLTVCVGEQYWMSLSERSSGVMTSMKDSSSMGVNVFHHPTGHQVLPAGHRGQWLYSDQIYSSPLHQQGKEIVYNPWRMQVEPSKV